MCKYGQFSRPGGKNIVFLVSFMPQSLCHNTGCVTQCVCFLVNVIFFSILPGSVSLPPLSPCSICSLPCLRVYSSVSQSCFSLPLFPMFTQSVSYSVSPVFCFTWTVSCPVLLFCFLPLSSCQICSSCVSLLFLILSLPPQFSVPVLVFQFLRFSSLFLVFAFLVNNTCTCTCFNIFDTGIKLPPSFHSFFGSSSSLPHSASLTLVLLPSAIYSFHTRINDC